MERWSFETLPLGESFEAMEEERRAAMAARSRVRPRARLRPRPRPRPQRWPGFFGGPLVVDAPACDCPGHDAPAVDDAGAEESFEFAPLEFEAPTTQPVLRSGSRGSAVADLQGRLAAAGFSPGPADGIFGARTDAAVRAFQGSRGLAADGVVGSLTWAALPGGAPVPSAGADRWLLPAAVQAAGDAQTVRYDSPPAWAGNPGNCTGTFTAGAQALRAHILASFAGVTGIGGYSCRQNTARLTETSVHGVGRALDIMITPVGGRANAAVGDRIANWLVQNAQAIGVQYVIWNRVRWSGSAAAGRKVAPYGGPNPHIDHIHAEINNDAAARRTPWFLGQGAPAAPVGGGSGTPGAATPAPGADAAIEALNLAEPARSAAYHVKARHPWVRFTSGRRDVAGQASAMAGNVVLNRQWIEQTYADNTVSRAAQAWVDAHPEARSKEAIAAGLLGVLRGFSPADLGRLSYHLSGLAFDIQPVAGRLAEIEPTIRSLPRLKEFLTREGGLERWHVALM